MYAKIFTQIFDSSIADNWRHRHVFEDLLKLCDRDGIVDMTYEAISRRTRIPLPIIREAIEFLSKPDPQSRSREEEGRRLLLVDPPRQWGWRVVNYQKYREMKTDRDRTDYMREYMRKRRENEGLLTEVANRRLTGANSASASVSVPDRDRGMGEGDRHIEWTAIEKWLDNAKRNGADYTRKEARSAWLAFEANGWMWGKNPVTDYRAAIERQIETDRIRGHSNKRPAPDYTHGI